MMSSNLGVNSRYSGKLLNVLKIASRCGTNMLKEMHILRFREKLAKSSIAV